MITALLQVTLLVVAGAVAPARPIPQSDYPAKTKVYYAAKVDALSYLCGYEYNCETGEPLYHTYAPNVIHRLHGWDEAGVWKSTNKREMDFFTLGNEYAMMDANDIPWAETAAKDLAITLVGHGLHVSLQPNTSTNGFPITVTEGRPDGTRTIYIIAMSWWSGTHEVEAIAVFNAHRSWLDATARHFLVLQLEDAIRATTEGV